MAEHESGYISISRSKRIEVEQGDTHKVCSTPMQQFLNISASFVRALSESMGKTEMYSKLGSKNCAYTLLQAAATTLMWTL